MDYEYTDPQSAATAAKQKRKAAATRRAYRTVFDTPMGQEVIADLMRMGGFHASTFKPDSHETSFNEGRRALVIYILHKLYKDDSEVNEQIRKSYEQNT